MLLANAAWILASNGQHVLVVDWDLEAPGLHRYFRPFLDDEEMTETDGVIDFVVDFSVAATTPVDVAADDGPDWFHAFADLSRYASRLTWDFPDDGHLDFVGAGRQGASYSSRVNEFNWQDFYEKFGGGALLDRARENMRRDYDYILVDSRTGVSDTSGICTVQLPDTVVVCFTLNNQSIEGASSVARSIRSQRGASVRVLPVPTRVERSEKDKLDLRRGLAMRRFGDLLEGQSHEEREEYWTDVEVLYEPFYAYEEMLATFKDRPGERHTTLASAERLTSRIADGAMTAVRISESRRQVVLAEYEGRPLAVERVHRGVGGVFLSYHRSDTASHAARLYDRLARALGQERVWMDVDSVPPGVDFATAVEQAVLAADVVVVLIGPNYKHGGLSAHEVAVALRSEQRVIPVLVGGARMPAIAELPQEMRGLARRQGIELRDAYWDADVGRLLAAVELAASPAPISVPTAGHAVRSSGRSANSDELINDVLRSRDRSRVTLTVVAVAALGALLAVLVMIWLR